MCIRDRFGRERQPVHDRLARPGLAGARHVLGVGGHDLTGTHLQRVRDRQQRVVLRRARKWRDLGGGAAGPVGRLGDRGHVVVRRERGHARRVVRPPPAAAPRFVIRDGRTGVRTHTPHTCPNRPAFRMPGRAAAPLAHLPERAPVPPERAARRPHTRHRLLGARPPRTCPGRPRRSAGSESGKRTAESSGERKQGAAQVSTGAPRPARPAAGRIPRRPSGGTSPGR